MAQIVAIDVEMAEVAEPSLHSGRRRVPIKVSVVDYDLNIIYDSYVKIQEGLTVLDFKTDIHGIYPNFVAANGANYHLVRERVEKLLRGNIVVGHSVMKDLGCFDFVDLARHRAFDLRCTATASFLKKPNGGAMGLKDLASFALGMKIQEGQGSHDSAEDARVAMLLYKKFQHMPLSSWGDAVWDS